MDRIGVPINFEGRYKWLIFLPSRLHPRVSVLNRYFGVMENGKMKVRGLEVRRSDTPGFVFNAQTDMLKVLAAANNSVELYRKIPEALEVVQSYRQRLLAGQVAVSDLIVTKHMSKQPRNYRQHVSQVIVAQQLAKEGVDVPAGTSVRFLFTNAEHKRHEHRVKALELIEEGANADAKKYLLLLYASAANLLSFAGYTSQGVYDAVRGQRQRSLLSF